MNFHTIDYNFCQDILFSTRQKLFQHVPTVHEGKKEHLCSHCGKKFGLSGNLEKHVKSVHDGEKPYQCSICNSCFSTKQNLGRHVKLMHNKAN